jgi:hypothetical protein
MIRSHFLQFGESSCGGDFMADRTIQDIAGLTLRMDFRYACPKETVRFRMD